MRTLPIVALLLLAFAGCATPNETSNDQNGSNATNTTDATNVSDLPQSSALCLEGTVCDDTPSPPGSYGMGGGYNYG